MVESGEDLGLALEAGHAVRVGGEGIRQDFDGDVAIQPGVGGPVNHAHAALAEFAEDLVVGDELLRAHQKRIQE